MFDFFGKMYEKPYHNIEKRYYKDGIKFVIVDKFGDSIGKNEQGEPAKLEFDTYEEAERCILDWQNRKNSDEQK
jgi:hypothetical protein